MEPQVAQRHRLGLRILARRKGPSAQHDAKGDILDGELSTLERVSQAAYVDGTWPM